MIKKSIVFILLTFFLSGCVERGQTVRPHIPSPTSESNASKVQPLYVLRLNANDREIDTTQNSIAGTLMLIIGLIIFL